jgi:hypothetical protein
MPSMVYLTFVSVCDTISLFVWNLSHFTRPNFGFSIESLSLFTCRFMVFIQFLSLQASSNLLSVLTVDRFVTIRATSPSKWTKWLFSTPKSALAWSISIISVLFVLNFHICFLNGYYKNTIDQRNRTIRFNESSTSTETVNVSNSKMICYTYEHTMFLLYPDWEYVHVVVYSFAPSCVMLAFNAALIYTAFFSVSNKNTAVVASRATLNKKRKLTISLLAITLTFLALTLPTSIVFAFFSFLRNDNQLMFSLVDSVSFVNHASLFFICLLTNVNTVF